MSGPGTRQLTVFGATTCEDTALVRSRLNALGIVFTTLDVDADPSAAASLARLRSAPTVTPTLVLGAIDKGEGVVVAVEPSLEHLGDLLAEAGYADTAPSVVQFHGDVTARPIPIRSLLTPNGEIYSLEQTRMRRQVALFFGHDASCLACFGYAKQLARQREELVAADAVLLIAAEGDAKSFATWRHEIGPDITILIDHGGEWRREVFAALGRPDPGTALLMLDRFAAPRAGSFATEAGGLANPSEASEWLSFVALDCPECSTELPWPEPS